MVMKKKGFIVVVLLFLLFSASGIVCAQGNDPGDNYLVIGVHGYPPKDEAPGDFESASGYFSIPEYGRNYIFAYQLSKAFQHGSEDYVKEIANFNDGSYRLGYPNPQCHISLAKCEWVYRKLFCGPEYGSQYPDDKINNKIIEGLLKSNLRFIDLFVSVNHIYQKLPVEIKLSDDTKIPLDRNALSNQLYEIAAKYDCPNMIRFITHSMGGMFILRYLTAPETEAGFYSWYREYTWEEFKSDIQDKTVQNPAENTPPSYLAFYHEIITELKNQGYNQEQAEQRLYEICKEERQNNVDKVILQDGPLSGSEVARYAGQDYGTLKEILSDRTLFTIWRSSMLSASISNMVLSGFEIYFGNMYAYTYFGQAMITHGIICITVDVGLSVVLLGTDLADAPDGNGGTKKVVRAFGNDIDMLANIALFDVDKVKTMTDLVPGSDFIKSYSTANPPQYRTASGELENIEIHNLTSAGVDSISGGGWGIGNLPDYVALGLAQTSLMLNFARTLLDDEGLLGLGGILEFETLSNGVFMGTPWSLGVNLGKLVAIATAVIFEYVILTAGIQLDNNKAHLLETLHGLAYDVVGLRHQKGSILFCHDDSTGLTPGEEINAIVNNNRSYVYKIDITSKNQGDSQAEIGNNSPARDQWNTEMSNMDMYANPFIGCHDWSRSVIFRPLSAAIDCEWGTSFQRYLYFNNYLFYDNKDPLHNASFADVSQLCRTMSVLKSNNEDESQLMPEWGYLNTSDLRKNPERDLFHYFMFGYNDGITPNNIMISGSNEFNTGLQIFKQEKLRFDRGLTGIAVSGERADTFDALNYIKVTEYVRVLGLDVYDYYPGLEFYYSINGESFRPVTHIGQIPGSPSLTAYGETVRNTENPQSSLVYDDHGKALLVSPHFKEGFNMVLFKFVDPAGRVFYKDLGLMQLTVPPFIKPKYPLMNQYIGSRNITAEVECLHIGDGLTMPDDWFQKSHYTVKIDGFEVTATVTIDATRRTVSFPLNNLSDGNHQVEFSVDYNGLKNTQEWRFWVDATTPFVSFPKPMIIANRQPQNTGGVSFLVKDSVPFRYGSLNYDVDTVFLQNLELKVDGQPIFTETNSHLGANGRPWNGWINGVPLSHGIHQLQVEARDRVGNFAQAAHDLIIDNQAPRFNDIHLNSSLVNLDSGLLSVSYNLGLDLWESLGAITIEVENKEDRQTFNLGTAGAGDQDLEYTLAYYQGGINVFKDGEYNLKVTARDETGNVSESVYFNSIIVDRTAPQVKNAFALPFVLDPASNQITIKFTANEAGDIQSNKSATLNLTINLVDASGNPVSGFTAYQDSLIPESGFDRTFTLSETLRDGKYFFAVTVQDKHQNKSTEMIAFIKNAIPPEITYPAANEILEGIAALRGSAVDPRWNNNFNFQRYELYYRQGEQTVPADLSNLTSWETAAIKTPSYMQKSGWPSHYGQFTVEGGAVIGYIDTSTLPDGLITILVVAVEADGYRIGAVRTYRILNSGMASGVSLTIDPLYKNSEQQVDFNTGAPLTINYTVRHSLDNPVDLCAYIRSNTGDIVKRFNYYNLQSTELKGKPVITGEKGIIIYQDESDRKLYIQLQNNAEKQATFFLLIDATATMTGFVTTDGLGATPAGLVDNGKKLVITKILEPNQSYITGFDIPATAKMNITAMMDNQTADIFLGRNKALITTTLLTLYPGSEYPPLTWDGKDQWGRYVVNGKYYVIFEAYGRSNGRAEDYCQIGVRTPALFNIVQVSNQEIRPGIQGLDYTRVTFNVNKPAGLQVAVLDAAGQKVRTSQPEPNVLEGPGNASFSWYGETDANQMAAEGVYSFRITASPIDGSPALVADMGSYPELGGVELSLSQNLNPGITAQLLPFLNAGQYQGKEVIQGDTRYQAVVEPKGQYLPNREAQLTVSGQGTQQVEAYPDLNYMAAFRTNYQELWAEVLLNQVKFTRKYIKNFASDSTSYSYINNIGYTQNQRVVSYTMDIDPVTHQTTQHFNKYSLDFSYTIVFKVTLEYTDNGWPFWYTLTDIYGASVTDKKVSIGTAYMSDFQIDDCHITNWGMTGNPWRNSSGGLDANYQITIYFKGHCDVRPDFDMGGYFALADGIAVMGPDIRKEKETVYAHHSDFANKAIPMTPFELISDPKASTGMGAADKTEASWREKPQYFFYYLGENYQSINPNGIPIDDANFGGGKDRGVPSALAQVPYATINPTTFTTGKFTNGQVEFTLTKNGEHYTVAVNSLAMEPINYPFPAQESGFETAHDIGDANLGIPFTRINGSRENGADGSGIPNYRVSVMRLADPTVKNVYFASDDKSRYTLTTGLTYQFTNDPATRGYTGQFDLLSLSTDNPSLPNTVNIKQWLVEDISAPGVTFTGLVGTSHAPGDSLKINDNHIAGIQDSIWTLANDNLAGGSRLYGNRKEIDPDILNRYGLLPEEKISDAYPFAYPSNTSAQNLYHTIDGVSKDNPAVVIHPSVRDYSNQGTESGYNLKIIGLDGEEFQGLKKEIVYFGKGMKLSDGYRLELTGQAPRELVAIYGRGEGLISLSYLDHKQHWVDIPVYNGNPAQNLLTYWNVTGLNGYYPLRLTSAVDNNGATEFNSVIKELYIGHPVNPGTDTFVNSADGQSKLILPNGTVTAPTIMNINTVNPEDIKDIAVLPEMTPVGKVIQLSPDGMQFGAATPQLQFTYHRSRIEAEGIDPRQLTIYYLKENGELEPLNTIKQLVKVRYGQDNTVIGEDVIWDSGQTPGGDITGLDYTYVRAWSVVTHFSYYVMLEGNILQKPRLDQENLTTGLRQIDLSGSGNPSQRLKVFVKNDPYLNPRTDQPVNLGIVQVNTEGRYEVKNIPLPFEGANYVYIGYETNAAAAYAKLIVNRDTTAPVLNVRSYQPYLSLNGDGVNERIDLEFTSNETGKLRLQIVDPRNQQIMFEKYQDIAMIAPLVMPVTGLDLNGNPIPDGNYTIKVTAFDNTGNSSVSGDNPLYINATPPQATIKELTGAISPQNQDGTSDQATIKLDFGEPVTYTVWLGNYSFPERVILVDGQNTATGLVSLAWNGQDAAGNYPPDGNYRLKIKAVDQAGNVNEQVFAEPHLVIDNAPPRLNFAEDNKPLFIPENQTFRFTLDEAARVRITLKDAAVNTVWTAENQCNAGNNQFSWNTPADLGDGSYQLTVTASDNLGNRATINRAIELTHDLRPPVLIPPLDLTVEANGPSTPVNIGYGLATDDSSPVTITNDAPAAFPMGTTVVTWNAVDRFGNTAIKTQTVTVQDTTPPVTGWRVQGTAGENGYFIADVTVDLVGTDTGSGVNRTQYRINGGEWQTYTSQFQLSGQGIYLIECQSRDNSGNIEAIQYFPISIDLEAPTVLAETTNEPGLAVVYLSGADSASGISRLEYTVDNGLTYNYLDPVTLTNPGTHNIRYRTVDYAGKSSEWRELTVTVPEFTTGSWINNLQFAYDLPGRTVIRDVQPGCALYAPTSGEYNHIAALPDYLKGADMILTHVDDKYCRDTLAWFTAGADMDVYIVKHKYSIADLGTWELVATNYPIEPQMYFPNGAEIYRKFFMKGETVNIPGTALFTNDYGSGNLIFIQYRLHNYIKITSPFPGRDLVNLDRIRYSGLILQDKGTALQWYYRLGEDSEWISLGVGSGWLDLPSANTLMTLKVELLDSQGTVLDNQQVQYTIERSNFK